jgi:hypothetical protein
MYFIALAIAYFVKPILAAAEKSLLWFNKHIQSVSRKYEYSFRFDARKELEEYVGDPYIFFGVLNISLRVETD